MYVGDVVHSLCKYCFKLVVERPSDGLYWSCTFVNLFMHFFSLRFEGEILYLTVKVPEYCLSFYFAFFIFKV